MTWLPYAQMKTTPAPLRITSAQGVYLYTDQNQALIDTTSSWWSMIHGYQHPEMIDALSAQLNRLSHVMLGGLIHSPAEELSRKLCDYLPGDLNHSFYSDSGSVAVEVALKMALQFFNNQAIDRTDILALTNSYHGDTFKAMSVGDDSDYHQAFPDKTGVHHIPPNLPALEEAFLNAHKLACFIVEPLLQGAGGMRMYSLDFLVRARQLCDEHGVLLIFDEVATGFGRTGNRFVADLVLPDILVLGKALTGGHIGHAVTVARDHVYAAFYSFDASKALMHGPTFMGNPLACTAALTSIRLFEDGHYLTRIQQLEQTANDLFENFEHEDVREVRVMGGCVAIEVTSPHVLEGYADYAQTRGVFARPFGCCLYAMVPYIITPEEYILVLETMKQWFYK